MEKDYIKSGDFYYDGEEWTYFSENIEDFEIDEDYDKGEL